MLVNQIHLILKLHDPVSIEHLSDDRMLLHVLLR